jgi:hypothetical protein
MNFNMDSLLKDKNVLYIVVFIAIANLLGYLMLHDFEAILFFLLVGFLTTYFSKNMIIILIVGMVSAALFKVSSQPRNTFFEGFEGEKTKKKKIAPSLSSSSKSSTKQKGGTRDDTEEEDDNAEGKKYTLDRAALVDKETELKKENSAKQLEDIYDKNDTVLQQANPAEVKNIMAQQKNIMESIKTLEPMMKTAQEMLKTMEGMGVNLGGMAEKFGGYEKLNSILDTGNIK